MRPGDLPDFANPPLVEVVVGVQFDTPSGYNQIQAGEIRNLFRADFPKLQEAPPLPPAFETFGAPSPNQFVLELTSGARQPRYWFLSDKGDELIQFQSDRLHHNWRKIGDNGNPYPRFEKMIEKFDREIRSVERFFSEIETQSLAVTQAEVSYFNHIYTRVDDVEKPEKWLGFVNLEKVSPDDFRASFRKTIRNPDGHPIGRLTCETGSATNETGASVTILNLVARGAPSKPTIDAALDFIKVGRQLIVNTFAEITTSEAHKAWGRVQ